MTQTYSFPLEKTQAQEEIQLQLEQFVQRHMRKELKALAVEGAFMQFREFLCNVMPGNLEALTALQLLENCEKVVELSVKQDVNHY